MSDESKTQEIKLKEKDQRMYKKDKINEDINKADTKRSWDGRD